jgi:hypothetical protein
MSLVVRFINILPFFGFCSVALFIPASLAAHPPSIVVARYQRKADAEILHAAAPISKKRIKQGTIASAATSALTHYCTRVTMVPEKRQERCDARHIVRQL